MGYSSWVRNTNAAVAKTAMGKYFRLEGSGHVRDNLRQSSSV